MKTTRPTTSPFHQAEFARTLFAESGDAMFLADPETDVLLEVNATALRLTGFAEPELLASIASSLFRFDQHGPAQPATPAKSAAQKTTVFHGRFGYLMRTKSDPGWRPVTLTVTRLHLKSGTLALYTARDDTDRRAALELARRSEARFRALVEKSAEGIVVLRADAGIQYASPSVVSVIGFTSLELEGKNWFAVIHPDDHAAMRAKLNETLAKPGKEVPSRCRGMAKGGGWRMLDIMGVNRLDDPAVGGLVLNVRDVTDRVRAEEESSRQHGLLRTLFNAIPDVVILKDRADRFVGGNPAFERLASRPLAQVIGRTCQEIFPAPWADRIREIEKTVLKTGIAERIELWIDHGDGTPRLFDFVIAPTDVAADGTPTGLAIIGRDLTDRKQLEDQLREAQKMDAVGRLAGGVAHDFNNLLTVVLGNLELARQTSHDTPTDDLLRTTEKAARRAADLTNQLLGFARKAPLRIGPVDLNALIRETAGLLRRTFDPKVVIREYPRPHLWSCHADPGQVGQVLMNLCLNARDALPTGGEIVVATANVMVSAAEAAKHSNARAGAFVRLKVQDTGTGMPEDVRARMFEPFFTTKEPGKGTGLGLSMVFGIVQAHDGWVTCDTVPGVGTTFEVYLPRAVAEPAAHAQHTPTQLPSPLGRGEAVLVADDEAMIRTLARGVLTRLGYDVTLAADGLEAVAAFVGAGGKFAAVVLDLTMPNLSGREALAQIRAYSPTVPVILASGYSADPAAAEAGVRYLDKPFAPTELAKAVREAIDGT